MLSFNKKKSIHESDSSEVTEQDKFQTQLEERIFPEISNTIKQNQVPKDSFICHGTLFTGVVKGEGNVIVEGAVEGSIICMHTVRIEENGHVHGEIHAKQIIINGKHEGSCYADSLSIQPKGNMHGDIYADEINIEKGAIFIGHSQPKPKTPSQTQSEPINITAQKIAASYSEKKESSGDRTQ